MATLSLKERMAQAKAQRVKQVAGVSSEETKVVQSNASTNSTKSTIGDSLAGMAKQISANNTKLASHIREQEEAGVYSFNDKIRGIEGLDADEFINKMQMLDQATVEKTPDIRTFTLKIRQNLQQYPELTHILTDEQLNIIVSGAIYISGQELLPKTKQGKSAKATLDIKKLSEQSLDDLF